MVHAVDEAGELDQMRSAAVPHLRLHAVVVAAPGLEHDAHVGAVAPPLGQADSEPVERGGALAAAVDQHRQGGVVELVGLAGLLAQGGPIEGGEVAAERHADGAHVGRAGEGHCRLGEGGGHVAGEAGGGQVGPARHRTRLVDERRHPRQPGGEDHRTADVGPHPHDGIGLVAAQDHPGLARRPHQGNRQLRRRRPGERHHVDEVELEPRFGHESALQAPGSADEADASTRRLAAQGLGHRQPREDVAASPSGGDDDAGDHGGCIVGVLPAGPVLRRRWRQRSMTVLAPQARGNRPVLGARTVVYSIGGRRRPGGRASEPVGPGGRPPKSSTALLARPATLAILPACRPSVRRLTASAPLSTALPNLSPWVRAATAALSIILSRMPICLPSPLPGHRKRRPAPGSTVRRSGRSTLAPSG